MTLHSLPHKTEVYRIRPVDFKSRIDVAACYVHCAGEFLLLHRAGGKSQEYTWGVPAGKFEPQESPEEAVIREVWEETGIQLGEQVRDLGPLYVRQPDLDFTYHAFEYACDNRPVVHLSDEHVEYRWVTFDEALALPLISGGAEALHQFMALQMQPELPRKGFYFVRHGQTDVNADPHLKRVDYDLPLNARGIKQAMAARDVVAKLPIGAVRSSPIQRATQTRDIILEVLDVVHQEDECLSECNAAIWNKMVLLEGGTGYEACPVVQEFLLRVRRGIECALQETEPVLIVAHGGVHWALCYLLGIEDHPWKIGNCEVVYFQPKGTRGWQATKR